MINTFAKRFYDLFYQRGWSHKLAPYVDDLSIDEAYRVQDLVAKMRIESGEEVVGFKVGCTSRAIRSQFDYPIAGF